MPRRPSPWSKQVGEGTPLGRILGCGAAVTGQVFGVERVPVVKRQAMPAYDPRGVQGVAVTYATTPMGADHTAGYAVTANILGVGGSVDPLKPEGQVELSRNLQIATAAIDATGFCLFIAFAILDQPETFQAMLDVIAAYTGNPLHCRRRGRRWASRSWTMSGISTPGPVLPPRTTGFPSYFKTEALPPHDVTFQVTDEELDQVFNW